MPRVSQPAQPPSEDFRRVLREKALSHSLFYLNLSSGDDAPVPERASPLSARAHAQRECGGSDSSAPVSRVRRVRERDSTRVSALVRHFDAGRPMQYLRPPRAASPASDETGDICSSDDEDRAAVRRRSRDFSDDSAVELEPRSRRASHPRPITPPPPPLEAPPPVPRRQLTLVEAQFIELGEVERRGSDGWEGRGRCVRTPSVVVSDYSEEVSVGATPEEAAWLRARALSADSACSSCSTLSSRDDDELDSPPPLSKKMISAE